MKSLFYKHKQDVASAFIIRLKGNDNSERLAKRCAESCDRVGQKYVFWDAYDGTKGVIEPPEHHSDIMDIIKISDHYMQRSEVAAALSHISLWAHCAKNDMPMVILEHDAIMLQPYPYHMVYNSIAYLGGSEQVKKGWAAGPTPPYAAEGPNKLFILRAHAYSIDTAMAKNLLAHVIKYGIHEPLDIMLRADVFSIHQTGIYAYDEPDDSAGTVDRSQEKATGGSRNNILNNDLSK